MDTTQSAQHSTASIDAMGAISTVHIVLMVLLAIAAILVIWWGSVLRRRRREADQQVAENREIAEDAGATQRIAAGTHAASNLAINCLLGRSKRLPTGNDPREAGQASALASASAIRRRLLSSP